MENIGSNSVRFSWETLPEEQRSDYFREVIARQFFSVDTDSLPDVPFRVDIQARRLSGVLVGSAVLSGTRNRRTRRLLNDGQNQFGFILNTSGHYVMSCRGREIVLAPGEAALHSYAEEGTYMRPDGGSGIVIHIPRSRLLSLIPGADDAVARLIPATNAALRLLRCYSSAVDAMDPDTPLPVQDTMAEHVCDLLALSIWSTFGARVNTARAGVRAVILHRIRQDILNHLHRRDLSLGLIAERHRLSQRYIQRLFATDKSSYSEFVLSQRLERAFDRLRNPRYAGRTVGEIAEQCGFGDISTFNHHFRRRYGTTPSQIRATSP